jgi:HPr kinase/phosphorylase
VRQTVHGTTVAVREAGLLIRGKAGSGKTTLALALVDRMVAEAVFARLVADDRTALAVRGNRLLASAPPAIAGCVEMRGRGIVRAKTLAAVRLTHVVDLVAAQEAPRMPEEAHARVALAGVCLPRLALPERSTTSAVVTLTTLMGSHGLTARARR